MKFNQLPSFLLLVAYFVFIPSHCSAQEGARKNTAIHFPDFYLEHAIREHFDKPTGNITRVDLERMASFEASGRGITDLTGLEYAINLKTLVLHNNKISDLSPLSSLKKLETLRMNGNKISDVSPIAQLTSLRSLTLMKNEIEDISPLRLLVNLSHINCHFNKISDISTTRNWKS